jgi:hypothetical protein
MMAPSYWCHGAPVDWFRPVQARHQCPLSYQAWVAAEVPGPDGFWPTLLLREDAAGDETRFGKQGPAILWYRRWLHTEPRSAVTNPLTRTAQALTPTCPRFHR